ncbi:MAG: sensor histidine kinase [Spirosomataceae bacterium]
MNSFKKVPRLGTMQILVWLSAMLVIFFSILPMDGLVKSVIYTLVNTTFYVIIVYGNILFLFPFLYERKKSILYIISVLFFLLLLGLLRGYATITLYNHFLPGSQRVITWEKLVYYIPAGILIFILSHIFRVAIAYYYLKQNTATIIAQKTKAELDLLKSRVQPHFVFNTLNNIYYEAYKDSPRTAGLIERLSDIMRYFVDESHKETISISSEVQFIENYMTLENIRLRHSASISFIKEFDEGLRIPPMLLMTLVENIFKHGIDKTAPRTDIQLSLIQKDGYLHFTTVNALVEKLPKENAGGFGIANLRKRLEMLYHSNFVLEAVSDRSRFSTFLKIPIE